MRYYTESELKTYARQHAQTITIRTYDESGSHDETRSATRKESDTIFKLLYGTLLGLNWGCARYNAEEQQCVIDGAEFVAQLFLPEANCYDTIYRPLMDFVESEVA